MLFFSGMISGSEISFFSLSPSHKNLLKESEVNSHRLILKLIQKPKLLLATILVSNITINISLIIISSIFFSDLFNFKNSTINFIIQILIITFFILLFGEVIPKTYANKKPLLFSEIMALPVSLLQKLIYPASIILVKSTNILNPKIKKKSSLSIENLAKAVEITTDTEEKEKKFLEGIIQFGQTDVKQIMRARIDIISIDVDTDFDDVIKIILDSGFSRIPVYDGNIDQIKGILYIKDLLNHFNKKKFNWRNVIREPFFVPENKKIDDLLKEIKERKIHLAVVVDEYGGTSGIVTLEDILEEIVGDISDEFDQENTVYSKLDENTYIFDGKTLLNDFYRLIKIDGSEFEKSKGESDTLAGFLLEKFEKFPVENQSFKFENFEFIAEKITKKRIVSVKVIMKL
ncbi:MAG: gliding motility-associated protein GldE [Bacteroidota bacterium]|nr:gliding motility-associated protein GldE [Bacteroidota bacterium]